MKIRQIDMDEQVLVLTVGRDGLSSVSHRGICAASAAEVLRDIAEQLMAGHSPIPCNPAEPEVSKPEIRGEGGSLSIDRQVWTDGTGHAWDLSVTWGSVGSLRWRWTGGCTESDVPLMRTGDGSDEQPFDLVWALYGPLFPMVGDRA